MKDVLKRRIIVEHCNSVLHRSYKQLSRVNETKMINYETMIKIAISMMIIIKYRNHHIANNL